MRSPSRFLVCLCLVAALSSAARAAGRISLDVGSAAFGKTRVGVAAPSQSITITNLGVSDLKISSISVAGGDAASFPIAIGNVPETLGSGASHVFDVGFLPAAEGGKSASVHIVSDDPMTPDKVMSLAGTGVVPHASVAPLNVDFGMVSVGDIGNGAVTITNTGSDAVSITGLLLAGPDAMLFRVVHPTPFSIVAGGREIIPIVFAPRGPAPVAGGTQLQLTTDDPNLAMASVSLSGAGTAPIAEATPPIVNFQSVLIGSTSPTMSFSIANHGNGPLVISPFVLSGTGTQNFAIRPDWSVGNPRTLTSGQSIFFSVEYTPSVAGTDSTHVQINSNDRANPLLDVHLLGVGDNGRLALTPGDGQTLDFGVIPVGQSRTLSVLVQNTGFVPVTIRRPSFVTMSNGFSILQSTPLTIPQLQSAMVMITYAPTSNGVDGAQIAIVPDAANLRPATITLKGQGLAPEEMAPDMGDSPTLADGGCDVGAARRTSRPDSLLFVAVLGLAALRRRRSRPL